jgi:hypothetical protein
VGSQPIFGDKPLAPADAGLAPPDKDSPRESAAKEWVEAWAASVKLCIDMWSPGSQSTLEQDYAASKKKSKDLMAAWRKGLVALWKDWDDGPSDPRPSRPVELSGKPGQANQMPADIPVPKGFDPANVLAWPTGFPVEVTFHGLNSDGTTLSVTFDFWVREGKQTSEEFGYVDEQGRLQKLGDYQITPLPV